MVALVVIAIFIGNWLEPKLNLNGLGPAILIFLATGIWIYRVIVTLNYIEREDKK